MERLVNSEVEALNPGSSQKRRNSSLWCSNKVVESALVGVEGVVDDSALEGVGRPDSGEKKRRPGQEGQG
jgi:hypothetical protein